MKRIEIESKLNESRNWLMTTYANLTDEQLRRPVTTSEHNADNHWSALDHFVHLALIEENFVAMIRRHVSDHQNPVGLFVDEHGATRPSEQIMASVHAMTEQFQREHHNDSLSEVVALTARARATSLALLSELSDTNSMSVLKALLGPTARSGACWASTPITSICIGTGLQKEDCFNAATAGPNQR